MVHETFIEAEGEFAREIGFLSKALGGVLGRRDMSHIHIEASEPGLTGVTTDGMRLHIVNPVSCPEGLGLAPGEWRVLRTAKKAAWIAKVAVKDTEGFVNWKRIIPAWEPAYTARFGGFSMERDPKVTKELVEFIRGFPEPTAIQMRYLADLGTGDWEVKYHGVDDPVVFEWGNRKAVMKPLRW
jgi:hypothetical protein